MTRKEIRLYEVDGQTLRVPWVTMWENDASGDTTFGIAQDAEGHDIICYKNERPEDRDQYGFLWKRETGDASGEPYFAHVSTARQRSSMLDRICQVCGNEIEEEEISWLMLRKQLEFLPDGGVGTYSAPTCEACIPVAKRLCPALQENDWIVVKVREYRMWGVMGETAKIVEGELVRKKWAAVRIGSDEMPNVLAKQAVVEFTDYTVPDE